MKPGRLGVLLLLIAAAGCHGVDMSWKQYSGRASLPRSKLWRDNMRATLAKLDVTKLEAADRAKVLEMREWLREDDYTPPWYERLDEVLPSPGVLLLALLVLGAAIGALTRVASSTGGRQLGSSGAAYSNRFSGGVDRARMDSALLHNAAEAAQLRRRAANANADPVGGVPS